MRHLILMRHGKAEVAPGSDDRARPLSGRGRAEATEAGRRIAALFRPGLVLVSDSARTRETWSSVAAAFDPAPPHRFAGALYGAPAGAILAEVRDAPDEVGAVLVIGHNPGIGDLARRLAGERDPADLRALAGGFPTSCFAALDLAVERWASAGAPGRLSFLMRSGA